MEAGSWGGGGEGVMGQWSGPGALFEWGTAPDRWGRWGGSGEEVSFVGAGGGGGVACSGAGGRGCSEGPIGGRIRDSGGW